jgi:hypothetical protein
MKWALAALGGAAVVHWAVREVQRVNAELDRVRTANATESANRKTLPTLRRDPMTGEWRVI